MFIYESVNNETLDENSFLSSALAEQTVCKWKRYLVNLCDLDKATDTLAIRLLVIS